jgi:hypothetical protein
MSKLTTEPNSTGGEKINKKSSHKNVLLMEYFFSNRLGPNKDSSEKRDRLIKSKHVTNCWTLQVTRHIVSFYIPPQFSCTLYIYLFLPNLFYPFFKIRMVKNQFYTFKF